MNLCKAVGPTLAILLLMGIAFAIRYSMRDRIDPRSRPARAIGHHSQEAGNGGNDPVAVCCHLKIDRVLSVPLRRIPLTYQCQARFGSSNDPSAPTRAVLE